MIRLADGASEDPPCPATKKEAVYHESCSSPPREDLAIWDFALDQEDMERIAALDKGCPSMLDTRKTGEGSRRILS